MKSYLKVAGFSNLAYLLGHSVMNQRIYQNQYKPNCAFEGLGGQARGQKLKFTFSTLHSIVSTSSLAAFSLRHLKKFSSSQEHSSLPVSSGKGVGNLLVVAWWSVLDFHFPFLCFNWGSKLYIFNLLDKRMRTELNLFDFAQS